jgi:hypothetical protein
LGTINEWGDLGRRRAAGQADRRAIDDAAGRLAPDAPLLLAAWRPDL